MKTMMTTAGLRKAIGSLLLLLALATVAHWHEAVAAPADSPWGKDYFPNIALVNQDGKTLKFYDEMIKDKVVLINFFYATCHDACTLETAKLRQVQEALGDRVGRDIFMYSISIDPSQDNPATLKAYMDKFQVGPGWQFLTGNEADINYLRKKLGLYEDGQSKSEHTMNMIIGNEATGRWKVRSTFDNPKVLAKVLGEQLFNFSTQVGSAASYIEAPKIAIDPGEDLFRRRCQVCHTMGNGDAVGPDLAGVVQRRERGWLTRWLMAPDAMLADKDPIATALFNQYKQIYMPNLKLAQQDAELLIRFMDTETRRLADVARAAKLAQAHDHAAHDHGAHDHGAHDHAAHTAAQPAAAAHDHAGHGHMH